MTEPRLWDGVPTCNCWLRISETKWTREADFRLHLCPRHQGIDGSDGRWTFRIVREVSNDSR